MKNLRTFESFINEDLRKDLKKYIKKNQEEIDLLADNGEWETIYKKLFNDFHIDDPRGEDAKEIKTIFNTVY